MLPTFRIARVDMNGFNGREHHPHPEDVGLVVRALGMESFYCDEHGHIESPIYRGRVTFEARPLVNGDAPEDTARALLVVWTCATLDGRLIDLLDFEVEPATAAAVEGQAYADALRACTGSVSVTVNDGERSAVSRATDDEGGR